MAVQMYNHDISANNYHEIVTLLISGCKAGSKNKNDKNALDRGTPGQIKPAPISYATAS